MKKYPYLFLITIAVIVISIIGAFWHSNSKKQVFIRTFLDIHLRPKAQTNVPPLSSIGFFESHDLLIQQRKLPFLMLNMGEQLAKTKITKIKVPSSFDTSRKNYYYSSIDSVTFLTNEVGEILKITPSRTEYYKINNLKYDLSFAGSTTSIFVRAYVGHGKQRHFEIYKLSLGDSVSISKKYVLPKQLDGIFCTDGRMTYEPKNNRLFYMYYYRGEFICLDSNLNLRYRAKTIDTVHRAKVEVVSYLKTADNRQKMVKSTTGANSRVVNNYIATTGDRVFILSALRSDNQSISSSKNSSTIDVYDMNTGAYRHSFTIPKSQHEKLLEFRFDGHWLYGLYRKKLEVYETKLP